jgi:CheY-like chemotaxis protein
MSHRLLLADDSVTIQRVIELTFADEDIEVIAVGDGAEAIRRIEADMPDIVLADVGMPEKDGYEVAAYVKNTPRLSHIPVLLLTGAFEPVDEQRAQQVGCDGVLAKPFEPQMVITRVNELLQSVAPRDAVPVATGRRNAPTPPPPPQAIHASSRYAAAAPSAPVVVPSYSAPIVAPPSAPPALPAVFAPPAPLAAPAPRPPAPAAMAPLVPVVPPASPAVSPTSSAALAPPTPPAPPVPAPISALDAFLAEAEAPDFASYGITSDAPTAPNWLTSTRLEDNTPASSPADDAMIQAPVEMLTPPPESPAVDPLGIRISRRTPIAVPGFGAPALPTAGTTAELDDYFEKLDAAFAALQQTPVRSEPLGGLPPELPPDPMPFAVDAPSVPNPWQGAGRWSSPPAERAVAPAPAAAFADVRSSEASPAIAQAFSALLAAEHGLTQAAESAAASGPATLSPEALDELVERVSTQVLERLSDRVVRDAVTDIVSRVTERLVREEIDRVKSTIK